MKKLQTNDIQKIAAFFIGSLVVLWFTLNITGSNLDFFPGDEGDARFNNYVLENGHQYLSGNRESLWDAPFMFPVENVISYSDNLIGSVPIYSLFRILSFDRETSFQLWFIAMFILSYACCFLFLKSQVKNVYAAVIGALIFSISMALQSQMTHAQVFPTYPIPLAFWMLSLFLNKLRPGYFFLALLAVVYQFYCGIYLGFFLCIPFGIIFLIGLFNKRKLLFGLIQSFQWNLKMVVGLGLNALLLAWLMLPYVERSNATKPYSSDVIFSSIPSIKSMFFSQDGTWIWTFLSDTGSDYPASWDHQIFVGGIALLSIVVVFGIWLYSKFTNVDLAKLFTNNFLKTMLIGGLLTCIIFLRVGEYSLYQLFWKLPGYTSLRSIARVINVELIFYAVAAAIVSNALFRRYKEISFLLFIGIIGLIIIDNGHNANKTYRTSKVKSQERVQGLTEKMRGIPTNSVVSYEPNMDDYQAFVYQIDAMLASQSLNLRTLNGYTAKAPYVYDKFWVNLDEASRKEWLDYNPQIKDSIYVIH